MGVITQKSMSYFLLFVLLRSPILPERLKFDYIFQFGDSINDTGNLEWDNVNSVCDRFPYGQSLPGDGVPRRCSDGLLMIDYFAKFFNVPISPYLEKGADLSHGVNFAVAGATALDISSPSNLDITSPFTNSSLSVQLKWFRSHLTSFCKDTLKCKEKLQKALVFMGEIGGNDYNFALQQHKSLEEINKMVPDVVQAIKDAAEEIINLGVVTMVVPGNFPMGCLPVYLGKYQSNDSSMFDDLNCLKGLNDFTKLHNTLIQLQEAIKELQQKYTHVTIVYADYYSALRWVIKKAPLLGFDENIQQPCCGARADEHVIGIMCGDKGIPICADPSKRISWEGMHFTQHAYQYMGQKLLGQIVPNILLHKMMQVV